MTTDPVEQAHRRWQEAIEKRMSSGEIARRKEALERARRERALREAKRDRQ